MQRFKIADVLIEIISDKSMNLNTFNSFSLRSNETPDLKIQMKSCDEIVKPEGILMIDEDVKWMYKPDGDKKIVIYICDEDSEKIIFLLEVDEYWGNASITYLDNEYKIENAVTGILGNILFRNSILFHQGFVIHASAIEWNGKGIMFSAPSGTGKSTQAKLWENNMGARILNDDCPGVRMLRGQNYVFGTPWSGSNNEFINDNAPIAAIVVLEQSNENAIRRLDDHEAVSMLMPRCFLPFYDSNIMNIAISNFENLISSTPVYLLKCKPDMEAVELVYQCVK
jgi:hypothetical protein